MGSKVLVNGSANLQTTICALPTAGGTVIVNVNITLSADVDNCTSGTQKAAVKVFKQEGVTITASSHKIFNTSPLQINSSAATGAEEYDYDTTTVTCSDCPGATPRPVAQPVYLVGQSNSDVLVEQSDAAMIIARSNSDSLGASSTLSRDVLSLQQTYSGATGTAVTGQAQLYLFGNTSGKGSVAFAGYTRQDSATTSENAGLHGDCSGGGAGVCVGVNSEGGGAFENIGYVSNQGSGTVLMPITAATWSGGVATLTVSAVTQGLQAGSPITVSGVSPSTYNGSWTVATVVGSTVTYNLTGPASSGSGGNAEMPSVYLGLDIIMHHSSTNTGGYGALFVASTGTHPYGISLQDDGGAFTTPIDIRKKTSSSTENIRFYQTDSGSGSLPSSVDWYRAHSGGGDDHLSSISSTVEDGAHACGRLTFSINDNTVFTDKVVINTAGLTVVSGVTQTRLPTSCSGLPTGTLYNNAGTPAFCP